MLLQKKLETISVLDSEIVELIDDETTESIHSTLLKTETALGQVVTLPIAPATTPSDYAHNV